MWLLKGYDLRESWNVIFVGEREVVIVEELDFFFFNFKNFKILLFRCGFEGGFSNLSEGIFVRLVSIWVYEM